MAPTSLPAPQTIDQVTQLINVLPKPLSIACLIENLPVPLKVFAVNSTFSAQPAVGSNSPRIFIRLGSLVLSVVPAGIGRNLLELGQVISANESVKAELTFPVTEQILTSKPYSNIREGNETSCRSCHLTERPIAGFAGDAFASSILRPDPFNRQTATRLKGVAFNCNQTTDPYRCQMLISIFVNGQAQDTELP